MAILKKLMSVWNIFFDLATGLFSLLFIAFLLMIFQSFFTAFTGVSWGGADLELGIFMVGIVLLVVVLIYPILFFIDRFIVKRSSSAVDKEKNVVRAWSIWKIFVSAFLASTVLITFAIIPAGVWHGTALVILGIIVFVILFIIILKVL